MNIFIYISAIIICLEAHGHLDTAMIGAYIDPRLPYHLHVHIGKQRRFLVRQTRIQQRIHTRSIERVNGCAHGR
jgi:hypothetical protein